MEKALAEVKKTLPKLKYWEINLLNCTVKKHIKESLRILPEDMALLLAIKVLDEKYRTNNSYLKFVSCPFCSIYAKKGCNTCIYTKLYGQKCDDYLNKYNLLSFMNITERQVDFWKIRRARIMEYINDITTN